MALTTKDVTGLVLVAGTVGLLVVHGTERHEPTDESYGPAADTVSIGSLTRAVARPGASTVIFVDVNLITDSEGKARRHQVVVVDEGTVTEVGPMGTVTPSPEALLVEGAGTDFLLPAIALPSLQVAALHPSRRVTPGIRSDLVLLPGDPRIEGGTQHRPEGLLLRGAWFSGNAPGPGVAGPGGAVGGH